MTRPGHSPTGPEQDQAGDRAGHRAAHSSAQARAELGVLGSRGGHSWGDPRCGSSGKLSLLVHCGA